jgi:hypothetical protein
LPQAAMQTFDKVVLVTVYATHVKLLQRSHIYKSYHRYIKTWPPMKYTK